MKSHHMTPLRYLQRPEETWKMDNVTVEEILNAYRQACQKLNCKPIPKVLKQIQVTDTFIHAKLDYKSCESLEEIFKRVQFKVVDLEQTNLDEDVSAGNNHVVHKCSYVPLKIKMMSQKMQLYEFCLIFLNEITFVGNFSCLDSSFNPLYLLLLVSSGLAYICEGLKEQRKGLVTLVLWNNQLTHNGMGYLAAALPFTQSLETLNLGHNAVGNEGVHKLKDGLIANRSILRLGLASTKLSCEGAVAIAEFIAESPRILRLDMRENEINSENKSYVKCFIETQRALLSDIQNGCKRNFILAKEKEETEQKMRQSISIAEIAMEDQTQEDEDASAEKSEEENTTDEGSASETSTVPRAPPSPGRCFSVSSPGRGHKIFMVTRVESPPEQQQTTVLAKGVSEWVAQSQTCTQTNIKAPFDARSQPPEQKPTASELSTLNPRSEFDVLHALMSTHSCSRNDSGCSISIIKKWPNIKDCGHLN
uniref:Protein phosphatase 1 regulatory subunit 37 n=1 Tax=Sinocyclocheilus rhinocerous TaxID=307959 RepID=A0A673H052_9TELE